MDEDVVEADELVALELGEALAEVMATGRSGCRVKRVDV